jgi:tRNA G18 (ribose-2'-O)-methylase SpoU
MSTSRRTLATRSRVVKLEGPCQHARVLIDDPDDPRVADYRAAFRDRAPGLFLCEGRFVVGRLLAAPRFRTRSLLATPRALEDLREALGPAPPPAFLASTATMRGIFGFKFHRGCLALGERPAQIDSPESVIEPAPPPGDGAPAPRLVIGLDDVSDPDNVGAIFRNAAAFGASGVLLSAGSADPLYRKTIRVSMAATLSIPFARTEWSGALDALRRAGYTLVALTPDRDAEPIGRAAPRLAARRLALIVGAEGHGLGPPSRERADVCVRIPMAPGVDSLNVATACGIALHRLAGGIMGGEP